MGRRHERDQATPLGTFPQHKRCKNFSYPEQEHALRIIFEVNSSPGSSTASAPGLDGCDL